MPFVKENKARDRRKVNFSLYNNQNCSSSLHTDFHRDYFWSYLTMKRNWILNLFRTTGFKKKKGTKNSWNEISNICDDLNLFLDSWQIVNSFCFEWTEKQWLHWYRITKFITILVRRYCWRKFHIYAKQRTRLCQCTKLSTVCRKQYSTFRLVLHIRRISILLRIYMEF